MYGDELEAIKTLPWGRMSPIDLAYISTITGREFAESLRSSANEFEDDKKIQQMISEELKTDNLQYADYDKAGDHVEMLEFFFEKQNLLKDVTSEAVAAGEQYLQTIRETFSATERMTTIISREKELPEIFKSILNAHDWKKNNLGFYEQYLTDHIRWDGSEGGHAELVSHVPADENVLNRFWKIRHQLYKSIPVLK